MVSKIAILYQNVRGLRTKTSEFFSNILNCEHDIICLTETWLLPGIFDSEIFDSRYSVYRCDRNYNERNDKMGGGVLIAVRNGLVVKDPVFLPSNDIVSCDVFSLCVALRTKGKPVNCRFFCCYFPQSGSQFQDQLNFYERISELVILNPKDIFLIVGDFNVPSAIWSPSSTSAELCENIGNSMVNAMSSFMSLNNFSQYNLVSNINNRQLDLVFSNSNCRVMRCETPLVKEDLHHPTLDIMLIDIKISSFLSPPRIVKLFHKADYKIINELLANIDWSVISDYYDIDTSVEKFYYIINDIITKNIPSKVVVDLSKYPAWYSPVLIKIIKEKPKYHKKWKMYDNYSDYSTFKLLRDRQKRVEKTCYDNYLDFAENNILRNSKVFLDICQDQTEYK
nr:uncharacterized protein LOC113403525 [Vanessa tameamea]